MAFHALLGIEELRVFDIDPRRHSETRHEPGAVRSLAVPGYSVMQPRWLCLVPTSSPPSPLTRPTPPS